MLFTIFAQGTRQFSHYLYNHALYRLLNQPHEPRQRKQRRTTSWTTSWTTQNPTTNNRQRRRVLRRGVDVWFACLRCWGREGELVSATKRYYCKFKNTNTYSFKNIYAPPPTPPHSPQTNRLALPVASSPLNQKEDDGCAV